MNLPSTQRLLKLGPKPDQWQAHALDARRRNERNTVLACGIATMDAVLVLLSVHYRML